MSVEQVLSLICVEVGTVYSLMSLLSRPRLDYPYAAVAPSMNISIFFFNLHDLKLHKRGREDS